MLKLKLTQSSLAGAGTELGNYNPLNLNYIYKVISDCEITKDIQYFSTVSLADVVTYTVTDKLIIFS